MYNYIKKVYVIDKKSRKIVRKYIFYDREIYIDWFNKNCIGKTYKDNPEKSYFIKIYTFLGETKKGVVII